MKEKKPLFQYDKQEFTEGLILTENVAAEHLERALGIKFTEKPHQIDLTWKNRLEISKKVIFW